MPDIPQRFSRTPAEIRRLQPNLGEHSVEILKEVGYSDTDIANLVDMGITCGERQASGRDAHNGA